MKAYKFKIRRPSKRIIQDFERTLDICRELYNAALQERRDAYRICRKFVNYYDQSAQWTEIRRIRSDVRSIYSQIGEEVLQRVDRAFKAFFRRCKKGQTPGYPRFRSKLRYDSFSYKKDGHKLEGDKLRLSKIGTVRLHLSRPVDGRVKTCTVKRQVNGWFVIFTVEENQSRFIPKTGDSVGIDVGIENFATLSTGEIIENPKYLRKAERKLKVAQRKISKKKRGSANRNKARIVLARKHLKVANQRRDFFHKLSLQLIRGFDEIAVEDLNIKGLLRNHHLAKSISDAAWNTFFSVLENKAVSAGRRVWKVPAAFTSQDCSQCGNRVKKSLAVREHRCIGCGFVVHRDHNAALNVLARSGPLASVGVS